MQEDLTERMSQLIKETKEIEDIIHRVDGLYDYIEDQPEYTSMRHPPPDALLTIDTVMKVKEGELKLYVLEPQQHDEITHFTESHPSFRNESDETGYFNNDGDGLAVTGTGDDNWWVLNESLLEWYEKRKEFLYDAVERYSERKNASVPEEEQSDEDVQNESYATLKKKYESLKKRHATAIMLLRDFSEKQNTSRMVCCIS